MDNIKQFPDTREKKMRRTYNLPNGERFKGLTYSWVTYDECASLSDKALDKLAGVLRGRDMSDEQLLAENIKLKKMRMDEKND